ncbi:hypothetical protein [Bartonella grahamii]|uniref:hypothetical protein n=1 Tax=Bartonella grahamii TaxID=33045 RepID=UPI001ABB0961|nr:hypothetical protein [Bartonella grahamii]
MKFLVFGGVVGAVVGLAHNGAKHMGVRWFVISNNGVFLGTIGLVPFFALEGGTVYACTVGMGLKKNEHFSSPRAWSLMFFLRGVFDVERCDVLAVFWFFLHFCSCLDFYL